MTLKKKLSRILMYCVCASLIISCCVFPVPVSAAEASSEFDFSAIDSIDAYDAYAKEEFETSSGEIVTRVYASAMNRIPSSINTYPPNHYRYGAYLRNSEEFQRYYFSNLDFNRPLAKLNKAVKIAYACDKGKAKSKTFSTVTVALRKDTKSFDKTDSVFDKNTFS